MSRCIYISAIEIHKMEWFLLPFVKEEKPVQKNRGMIIAFVTPALLFFVATFVYPIIRTIKWWKRNTPWASWTFGCTENRFSEEPILAGMEMMELYALCPASANAFHRTIFEQNDAILFSVTKNMHQLTKMYLCGTVKSSHHAQVVNHRLRQSGGLLREDFPQFILQFRR